MENKPIVAKHSYQSETEKSDVIVHTILQYSRIRMNTTLSHRGKKTRCCLNVLHTIHTYVFQHICLYSI